MATDEPLDVIEILYARSGPERDEPMIAVVSTEDVAQAIGAEVAQREPETRVVWETHEAVGQVGDTVHIVILGFEGDTTQEGTDPIAVGLYANLADAERDLAGRRTGDDGDHCYLRSLPLGWRRLGWSFART